MFSGCEELEMFRWVCWYGCDLLLGPLVLTTDLILLLRGEVVLDIEGLADLLRRLALDHIGNGLAADIQESLDIHVIGSLNRRCIRFRS